MSEVDDDSVNLVVTSPPYFSLRDYSVWENYKDYLSFMQKVSDECFRVLQPGGWACINVQDSIPFPPSNGNERYSEPLASDMIGLFRKSGFNYEKGIIWYKGKGTATQRLFGSFPNPGLLLISSLTEHILLFRKWRDGFSRVVDARVKSSSELSKKEWAEWTLDLWKIRPESSSRIGHPAPYPIEIPYRLIRMFSFEGDVVLDPFLGSGTTALAARRCDRNYIGYEIHEKFKTLTKNRLIGDLDIFQGECK